MVGNTYQNIVAHHVRCLGGGGMGMKPPDWMCVPLTDAEHKNLHVIGENQFWKIHQYNPAEMICMTMLVYLSQNPGIDLLEKLARAIEE